MAGSTVSAGVIADAVAAAKTYLRLADDAEDALIAQLAASAIAVGEAFCHAPFVVRAFEDVVSAGSGWQRLAQAPVSAILGATGLPAQGAPFVMPVEAYGFDIDPDGMGWVCVLAAGAAGRVAISYSAGLASDWSGVPAPIAQGVTILIAHLFTDRASDSAPPAAVGALWRPYRRMTLGHGARV
ncbi:MAG: hypothetical protein OSB00_10670 [Sphingomonas bacterium]|nr:hypothetical protein [Sphingomonas bacterium]